MSLPVSITASWVVLIMGLATSLIQVSLNPGTNWRTWRFSLYDLNIPPLLLPLAIFALAVFLSGWAIGGLIEA